MPVEEMLTRAEQHRTDRQVQFVDEAGPQILPIVATPPPSRTSLPPAAAFACSSAAWMPSVTKRNSVPPAIAAAAANDG